jgi:hypothetical protein
MHPESAPGRARPSRITAAVLLLAFASAPLLEAAHAARVQHVACPQDGELIDAAPQKREIAHSDALGSVLPSDAPEREHAHDHCCLAVRARSRARVSAGAPFSGAAIAAVLRASHPTGDAPRPASFALYLLAPKVSPPAV